jgi:hypothetical protein
MWWRVRVLRFLGLLGLIVWVGGFTFYSAGVIPVLHDVTPSRDAGRITQRVTDRLNLRGGDGDGLAGARLRRAACRPRTAEDGARSCWLRRFLSSDSSPSCMH